METSVILYLSTQSSDYIGRMGHGYGYILNIYTLQTKLSILEISLYSIYSLRRMSLLNFYHIRLALEFINTKVEC